MTSRTTKRFRDRLAALPKDMRRQAGAAYRLFRQNPRHPSLQFKQVHTTEPVYSVRIGLRYRAVGVVTGNEIVWFWVGKHEDYEALLRTM
jgi:hypothetical protein